MDSSQGTHHRGSQRALKMLNALQKPSSQGQQAPRVPAPRLTWPQPRPAAIASLDPTQEAPKSLQHDPSFAPVSQQQALHVPVQHSHSAGVTTPTAKNSLQQSHLFSSPEASIPSNGNIAISLDTTENELRDGDASRNSLGISHGLLAHDFNNSNTGFTAPGLSQTEAQATGKEHGQGQVTQAITSIADPSTVNSLSYHSGEGGGGGGGSGEDGYSREEDETRSNMCFSLCEGKVTSVVATTDGAYCIAGFATGAIRLFDLTKDGNMDPEDRFGYQIGNIESSRGSVQVQLQLGNMLNGTSYNPVDCCHLFAGAVQGSTTMLVIDIGLMREIHKKRGFITVAGGGVQSLTHTDARLKGLAAVSAMSVTSTSSNDERGGDGSGGGFSMSVPGIAPLPSKGYVAKYRLVTGRGFGSFHVWGVTIDARASSGSIGSPLGGGSSCSGTGLLYQQEWAHLFQGLVNGPTMSFASLAEKPQSTTLTASMGSSKLSLWQQCQQTARLEDTRSSNSNSNNNSTSAARVINSKEYELLTKDNEKDIRSLCLVDTTTVSSAADDKLTEVLTAIPSTKPQPLKDTANTFACSQDGRVLLGGKYELVVAVLSVSYSSSTNSTSNANSTEAQNGQEAVRSSVISYRAFFSLSDFAPGVVSQSRKKTSRHLREISQIYCTPDGCYALILCSDNAVLLFSVCDVTGRSSFPTRTEGTATFWRSGGAESHNNATDAQKECGGGFLTYLFEADDSFNLDLGIAYALSEPSGRRFGDRFGAGNTIFGKHAACQCGIHSGAMTHLSPENVLVGISWWLVENPMLAGVLKVCRLRQLPREGESIVASIQNVVPLNIATSMLKLESKATTAAATTLLSSSSTSNPNRRGGASETQGPSQPSGVICCLLCGDITQKHWANDALTVSEISLGIDRSPSPTQNSAVATAPKIPLDKEKESRRPPVGKKRDSLSGMTGTSSAAKTGGNVNKEKKQKTAHFSDPCSCSDSDAPASAENSRSGYFSAPGSGSRDSSVCAFEASSSVSAPVTIVGEVVDLVNAGDGDGDDYSLMERTQSAESLDDNECDYFPSGHRSQPAVRKNSSSMRRSRSSVAATGSVTADNQVATSSVNGANKSGVEIAELTTKELRQELERVKAENRRLRIDTDLTMRKADRRFELEMVARRYWKSEKTQLEGVIAGLQKDSQRWVLEKEKLQRRDTLLQNLFYAVGDAVGNGADMPVSVPVTAGADAIVLSSPATQLRTELTALGDKENMASSSSYSSTKRLAAGTDGFSGGGGRGAGSVSNGARRVPFFCIVCLDHTARVAIQPCGHICFCSVHAEEMKQRAHDHHYSKCPLCQAKIAGFLTLQGVEG